MKNIKLLSIFGIINILIALQGCGGSISDASTKAVLPDSSTQEKQETKASSPSPSKTTIDETKAKQFTDTARFIAGLPVEGDSKLAKFQSKSSNSWLAHQQYFQQNWSKLETRQLSKVREWSKQEIQQINQSSPSVFYPFSGPDFLYAYSLFPKGKEFVMMGLEPVGKPFDITSLPDNKRDLKLQEVRSSLFAILQFSFFRTNDMKVDLQKQGVLPVLYVFLARTQNRILDVQEVGINKEGSVEAFKEGMISGIKIAFVPEGESEPRNLYYFSTDLSNDGIKKRPELAKFVSQQKKDVTYLKAASYLMYNESFSNIKEQILAQSDHVLQDDSGMPLRAFDKSKWDLQFYGAYTRPIDLFKNSYQADLRQVYATDKTIKRLNFGIGYQFVENSSNMMLAKSKN